MKAIGSRLQIYGFVNKVIEVEKQIKKMINLQGKTLLVIKCLLMAVVFLFSTYTTASAQLNENCTVSVLNRTANVQADGTWTLPNTPANMGQVRARATCVDPENGVTISGQSDYITVTANGITNAGEIMFGDDYEQVPSSLNISSDTTIFNSGGDTAQLTVIATYPDGSSADVTAANSGTSYTISNTAIATIDANGLVTAVASGTVIVSASNEAVLSSIAIKVELSGDSDGDGIPDDAELKNDLNPNNPIDALEDPDLDGLTNKEEYDLGTGLKNPDTDGDDITDGEEVVEGEDGYITDPTLPDSDGDGIWDGLEIETGSDPNDKNSRNLRDALDFIEVIPSNFVIVFNTIMGEATRQLAVTGTLVDGHTMDLTSSSLGTNYASSDLKVANFGLTDGLVFAVQDGIATITATNSGFSAEAVATIQPFAPQALSFVRLPERGNNVDVANGYAYIAGGSEGLFVVDVSNPESPSLVTSLDTPGTSNDIKISGNNVYIADGSSGLRIIDISAPSVPLELGFVDTPDEALDLVIRDNLAFVADGSSGLQVVDITDPANPAIVGSVDTPGTASGVDVDIVNNLAVVADWSSGLQVIGISDPTNPQIIGSVDTSYQARDLVLNGNIVYLADYPQGGLKAIDISNPAAPAIMATESTGGYLNDIAVSGSLAFGADTFRVNAVPIYSIVNPENPVFSALIDFSQFGDHNGNGIDVDNEYVYLTTSGNRLYIGQYRSIQDFGFAPPDVSITSPIDGDDVIEGSTIQISADATDDVFVASVSFLIDGEVVFTDTSSSYQFNYTVPAGINGFIVSASAIDLANNIGTSGDVIVNVIPDPLTTVNGTGVDKDGIPVSGVEVITNGGVSGVTAADGSFSIPNIPTISGGISVIATFTTSEGILLTGASTSVLPVAGGVTDVGMVVISEIPRNGLVAYYPFNDNANDESGNGNDGTVFEATLTTDRFGNVDRAYSFDGVNDNIDLGKDNSSLQPQLPVTIAAWVKINSGGHGGVFANNYVENSYHGIFLTADVDVSLQGLTLGFGDGRGGTAPQYRRSKRADTTLNAGTWYHIVGIIRGATDMDIYVDGMNIGGTYSGTGGSIAYSNSGSGNIGRFDTSWSRPPFYINGVIDEVCLYNRVLSDTEIQILFLHNDPLTTVVGTVVDRDGIPVSGAEVTTNGGVSGVTAADGSFSIPDVRTILGDIKLNATFNTIDNTLFIGMSAGVPPVSGGITDIGIITMNANLLANRSFEQGQVVPGGANDSFIELQPGSTVITGWVVTRDAIDYEGPNFIASDGVLLLDLDAGFSAGGIAQAFETIPGQQYNVKFDMAGNPACSPTVKEMRVEAADQSADFSFDITGHSLPDPGWITHFFTFTAVDTSTTLEFFSLDTPGSCGPVLDNVSVVECDHPACN